MIVHTHEKLIDLNHTLKFLFHETPPKLLYEAMELKYTGVSHDDVIRFSMLVSP